MLFPPFLQHCRRLFLKNYMVNMHIGAHDFEKDSKQNVLINIDVYVPLATSTPLQDELVEVFDYDLLRTIVIQHTARGHIHLQETLCDEIAQAILMHASVKAVRVSTAKTDVYADCEAVGIEVFHVKPTETDAS
jgi:dihydroneopterin aldolase